MIKLTLSQTATVEVPYFDWDGDITTHTEDDYLGSAAIIFVLTYDVEKSIWTGAIRNTETDWTLIIGILPEIEAKRMIDSSEFKKAKSWKE